MENINQDVVKAHYAVRGDIVTRATEIQEELEDEKGSWPFSKLVRSHAPRSPPEPDRPKALGGGRPSARLL